MATIGTVQLSALQSRLAHWSRIHRLRGTPPGDRMSLVLEAGLEIEGDVVARGRVTVKGAVRGNIYCHTLDLSGTVHGDVVVKRLIVHATGSLHGRPRYDDLELHDGGGIVEPTTGAPQREVVPLPPRENALTPPPARAHRPAARKDPSPDPAALLGGADGEEDGGPRFYSSYGF